MSAKRESKTHPHSVVVVIVDAANVAGNVAATAANTSVLIKTKPRAMRRAVLPGKLSRTELSLTLYGLGLARLVWSSGRWCGRKTTTEHAFLLRFLCGNF